MKCTNCKATVPVDFRGQTCPSCGEPLPAKKLWFIEWGERIADFTNDRSYLFWLIVLLLLLTLFSLLENLIGAGQLVRLLDQYKFISLLMIVFVTGHLKLIRNINATIRPGYPGPYWVDRIIIRKFRTGTNLMLLLGLLTSFLVCGPFNIFALLPAYVLIISLFTALFWSIQSFRVDDREFQDAKVHSYFEFLGVVKLHLWRKVSGAYMIGLVISAALFYGLSHVHGLWWMIKQNPVLNEIIETGNALFSWVPQILPKK